MDLKGYGPTLRVSHIRSGGLGAASSHLSQRSPLQITHPTTLAQMSCSTSRFLIIHFCITSFQNSSHQCGWQKNLTRAQWCASLCCVNSGQVELGFPESPSLFGSRRKGQKNVHGMRQTKVKQQLSLSEISRDQRGTEVPCGSPPPPQLSLAPHPPVPLQAQHRQWAADPQTLRLHRGDRDIIRTTAAAHARQTWSVATGEERKLTRL